MFDTSKIKSSAVAALIALAALFSFSSTAQAQTATGGIRGVVADPTGAALPGAAVTARNVATGVESKTTATNEGVYSIPRILIPNSIALDNAGSLFYNFQENSGGRRTISMGLRLSF